jgi:hypothetical protein
MINQKNLSSSLGTSCHETLDLLHYCSVSHGRVAYMELAVLGNTRCGCTHSSRRVLDTEDLLAEGFFPCRVTISMVRSVSSSGSNPACCAVTDLRTLRLLSIYAGATDAEINAFPTVTLSLDLDEKEPRCPICLEDYMANDVLRQLPCGHRFHCHCADLWLKQKATCPLCKQVCVGQPPQGPQDADMGN